MNCWTLVFTTNILLKGISREEEVEITLVRRNVTEILDRPTPQKMIYLKKITINL